MTVIHLCVGIICLHLYPLSLPLSLICTERNQMVVLQNNIGTHPFSCAGLAQDCCLCSKGSSSSSQTEHPWPQQRPGSAALRSPAAAQLQLCYRGLVLSTSFPFLVFITFFGLFRERKQAGFALQLSFKVKINAAWEKANMLDVEVLVIHGKKYSFRLLFEYSFPSSS